MIKRLILVISLNLKNLFDFETTKKLELVNIEIRKDKENRI